MPFFKLGSKLVYYAHVPKCGGSAVEHFIHGRVGQMAFVDQKYLSIPEAERWSKTSPQHINVAALERLFPHDFFDLSFTIVRHPVARVVSAYHFQMEEEKSISTQVNFSHWLEDLADTMAESPYIYDNHLRPMDDIVPQGAHVFYLEHGLDVLVPWFDDLTGKKAAPRAVHRVNERKAGEAQKVKPTAADLDVIAELYRADFARFGYEVGQKTPKAPVPVLSAELIAERDAEIKAANSPLAKASKIAGKIRNRIGK